MFDNNEPCPRKAYLSGQVLRYHNRPGINKQSDADHTWGMLALLYTLHPDPSPSLVKAITIHDMEELFGGDLPHTFKIHFPQIAKEHRDASIELAGKCIPDAPILNREELQWLKLLDSLEAYFWVETHHPHIALEDEWQRTLQLCTEKLRDLGVKPALIDRI